MNIFSKKHTKSAPLLIIRKEADNARVQEFKSVDDAIADLENDPNVSLDKIAKLKATLKQLKDKTSIIIRNGEIIIPVLLLMLIAIQGFAQNYPITAINITLPASPDANTANWGSGVSMFMITATARSATGKVDPSVEESKLLITIKKGGSMVCGSYTGSSAPAADFNTMTKVWSGSDAVSYLGKDCLLTPGDYEICVQFFGYGTTGAIALSDEKCKPFTIKGNDLQAYQPPQPISPASNSVFTEKVLQQPLIFRWTPVIPRPHDPVTYRLKVWQLMQGQSGTQVMNANQPLITKEVDNITQTVVTNLISGPCAPPGLCDFIWHVQAVDREGKPVGDNNGTSEPSEFKADTTHTQHNTLHSPVSGCATLSTKSFTIGDYILLSDNFKMKLTAIPTGTNDSLSGKGIVKVKWLGILNVRFKGIKINGQDKLCSGAIYTNTDSTQVYPTQWAINAMNNNSLGSWTINKIKGVSAGIKANKNLKPLVKATDQVDSLLNVIPLNMPLGYFKANDTTTCIGFTEMVFKADHAEFEVIASLPTKGIFKDAYNNGTEVIALHGSGITFTDTGLKGITGSIKLLQPLTFLYAHTGTESLKLTFNTEGDGHLGNGITFSSTDNEFWKYDLDADVALPKEWLIPVDTAKTNVAINFQMEMANWDDYVLQGSLPACTIPHSNGVGIEAGAITYDHSSVSNAPGMVFPDGYAGDTTSIFSGFYLKSFKLTLPDQLRSYADTSKKVNVVAENLIIDKDGITGKVSANNVLNYPKANIGNLGASIDTVKIGLANSVLTEATMLGKITLPLSSSDDSTNAINYSAMFQSVSSDTSSITFALRPGQDIKSKFLGDGKVQIDQTSSLNLGLSKTGIKRRKIQFNIDLNGKLYYPTGKIIDPGSSIPLDLDLSCNFEHLGMSYTKSEKDTFKLSTGHWSFASPQKKLAGFAFNITDVKPKIEPIGSGSEKQYLFKGGVEFDAKINIGSENSNIAISGDTKIFLTGAIESSLYTPPGNTASNNSTVPNLSTITSQSHLISNSSSNPGVIASNARADYGFMTQLKPKYLGVQVESINIDSHMPAVAIKGSVAFYKHDPVYGNGFKGDLTAKFTTLEMAIQAGAIFGNTKYIPNNTTAGFKYWMVQAQVNLPPPGIVFMTGIAFRGFGAGVYSRMNMTPPATFIPATANSSTFGGAVFTPNSSISIGFKVKAIIATTPKEETFNGSVALGAQFNTSGGMDFITIDGLFNCGAKIGMESKSFANGALAITYDFPQKKFSTSILLNINKDPITTPSGPIQSHFYIDGMKNEWAFTCGTPPSSLNTVRLFNAVDVSEYLMFGNKIVPPAGFMPRTVSGFAGIGKTLPSFSQTSISNESKTAKGFAFGIGVFTSDSHNYSLINRKHLTAGINYSYDIGSEINASLMQYQNCPGFGEGWRIKAGIALFADMTGTGYCTAWGFSYQKTLLSLGFGAYAYAEFPKPFYAEGSVHGNVNVLDVVSFDFDANFKTGEQCAGTSVDIPNVPVYNQEDATEDLNCTLINSIVTPGGTTDISRTTTFAASLNYPDSDPFDIQEQQASGQMNVRTFRAVYIPALTQDSLSGPSTMINNHAVSVMPTAANVTTNSNQVSSQPNSAVNTGAVLSSNNPVNTTAPHLQSVNALNAMAVTSNVVGLVASGYDALGARLYKLTKTGMMINPLKPNTTYKFLLTGRLEEKINNNWQTVINPATHAPIVRTKLMYFKTNSEPVGTATTSNQTTNAAIHL